MTTQLDQIAAPGDEVQAQQVQPANIVPKPKRVRDKNRNKTGIPGRGAYQRARNGGAPSDDYKRIQRARAEFISLLRAGGRVSLAARQAGSDKATMYRWRMVDAEFAAEWDAAVEEGLDQIEQRVIDATEHDWRAGAHVLACVRPNIWGKKDGGTNVTVNTAVLNATGPGSLEEERRRIAELEQKLLGRVTDIMDGDLPGMTVDAVVIEDEPAAPSPAPAIEVQDAEVIEADVDPIALRTSELISMGRSADDAGAIATAEFAARGG